MDPLDLDEEGKRRLIEFYESQMQTYEWFCEDFRVEVKGEFIDAPQTDSKPPYVHSIYPMKGKYRRKEKYRKYDDYEEYEDGTL